MSSANSESLPLPFQFGFLLLPFLLIVVSRTSNTILNKNGERRHPCIPDFRRNVLPFTSDYNVSRVRQKCLC